MVPHAFLAPPFVKSRITLSKAVEYVIGERDGVRQLSS
jgi:hypothetical protein